MSLQYVSDVIRKDKDVVIEAVKQNNKILSYVSENLKNDRDFILEVEKIHVESSGIKNKY